MSEDVRLEGTAVRWTRSYFGGKRRKEARTGCWRSRRKGSRHRRGGARGKVVAVVANAQNKTILHVIHEWVLPESIVYTDHYQLLWNWRR